MYWEFYKHYYSFPYQLVLPVCCTFPRDKYLLCYLVSVENNIWKQVIELYPYLVDCTTSSSPQVCKALKEALHEYQDLLSPLNAKTRVENGM